MLVDADVIAELADMAATDPPGYPRFACEGSDCFEVAVAAAVVVVEGDEEAFLFFDALFGD